MIPLILKFFPPTFYFSPLNIISFYVYIISVRFKYFVVFSIGMKKRTIILYDLKTKTQTEKVKALRMLYGYLGLSAK